MKTTTIRIPNHFATADYADIQREIIGLIWEKHPTLDGIAIDVQGVRNALVYHGPNVAWPSLKHSRAVRTPGMLVEVRYVRA